MTMKPEVKDSQLPQMILQDYFTITELCKTYPRFKQSTVRHYIRKKEHYNFEGVVVRFHGKLLLHKKRFIEWTNNHIKEI